jgi:hypothetical protein
MKKNEIEGKFKGRWHKNEGISGFHRYRNSNSESRFPSRISCESKSLRKKITKFFYNLYLNIIC